jgi:hypothetical protein
VTKTLKTLDSPDLTQAEKAALLGAHKARFRRLFTQSCRAVPDHWADDFAENVLDTIASDELRADVGDIPLTDFKRQSGRVCIAYIMAKLTEGGLPPVILHPETGEAMEAVESEEMAQALTGLKIDLQPGEDISSAVKRAIEAKFGPDARVEVRPVAEGTVTLRPPPESNGRNRGGVH